MATKHINHDLTINSSGAASSPALRINNLNHTTYNHGIEVMNGNLVQGESEIMVLGKTATTKNSGYIGYYWHANASDDNFVTIGHWSNNHLFRVYGSGSVVATTNMQAPIFYDSDNTGYYVNPAAGSKLVYLGLATDPNSSGSYRLNMGGSIDMNANNIDYVSQLHFNDNVRFLDEGNDSYLRFKYGDTNNGGIIFRNGSDTLKGYIYADNGGFGLLDNDGAWALRTQTGTNPLQLRCDNNNEFEVHTDHTLSLCSSRAPIFYDSADTSFYVDPNATTSGYFNGELRTQNGNYVQDFDYRMYAGGGSY